MEISVTILNDLVTNRKFSLPSVADGVRRRAEVIDDRLVFDPGRVRLSAESGRLKLALEPGLLLAVLEPGRTLEVLEPGLV